MLPELFVIDQVARFIGNRVNHLPVGLARRQLLECFLRQIAQLNWSILGVFGQRSRRQVNQNTARFAMINQRLHVGF